MASVRPLFRAPRPGYKKTTISIQFKYHSTEIASYRIKRGLIHILSGHVLELIATGIFYGFLNIYKILRLLREQNIVRFQRPKITSDTWFLTEKECYIKKQSLSFQNMLSKLWATYEMNFGERKIHRALEFNLTFLTRRSRGSVWHKSFLQQMFQPKYTEHLSLIWPFWLDGQEVRCDTNHSSNKCFSQNTLNLGNLKSQSHT